MISDTTSRKAFSQSIPGLQFAFDSVSLGLLKECPRKYQYTILEGWIPSQESVHLTFGLHYHKAIEIYDHRRAAGSSHDDALDSSVDYCLRSTIQPTPLRQLATLVLRRSQQEQSNFATFCCMVSRPV